jgi:hypothetical protein
MAGSNCLRKDILSITDLVLVVLCFIDVKLMVSLNILRVVRALQFLSGLPKMSTLKEITSVLQSTLTLIIYVSAVYIFCTIFVSMFLNNLTVEEALLGQQVSDLEVQVLDAIWHVQDR